MGSALLTLGSGLILFLVTIFWVGKNPSLSKVGAMICIIVIVNLGFDLASALSQGTSIYGWYLDMYNECIDAYSDMLTTEQIATLTKTLRVCAGCVVGFNVIQAAVLVGIALVLVWVVRRLRGQRSGWVPFSQVDLPVWTVGFVIVGLLLIALGNVPSVPYNDVVSLVALNVLCVAVVPLFVQGAAAGKGVMNRIGMGPVLQFVWVFILTFIGLTFVVVPIFGLVDYWANLRKLPRDAGEAPAE